MSTILFDEIVFGPIKSRRLGNSLGMNLLPYDGKLCSFDCVYCECGFNKDFRTQSKLPSREEVKKALENKLQMLLQNNVLLNVITFAGNGEPTLHPQFKEIIEDTIELRNSYYPETLVSVLTNGMHADKESIFQALKMVDNNILKLDSAFDETVKIIDRPNTSLFSVSKQIERYKKFGNNIIIQTMFVKGEYEGKHFDNTTNEEVTAWIELIKELKPREVMIYTIDRETPLKTIEKISVEKLNKIAAKVEQLGIKTNVAG